MADNEDKSNNILDVYTFNIGPVSNHKGELDYNVIINNIKEFIKEHLVSNSILFLQEVPLPILINIIGHIENREVQYKLANGNIISVDQITSKPDELVPFEQISNVEQMQSEHADNIYKVYYSEFTETTINKKIHSIIGNKLIAQGPMASDNDIKKGFNEELENIWTDPTIIKFNVIILGQDIHFNINYDNIQSYVNNIDNYITHPFYSTCLFNVNYNNKMYKIGCLHNNLKWAYKLLKQALNKIKQYNNLIIGGDFNINFCQQIQFIKTKGQFKDTISITNEDLVKYKDINIEEYKKKGIWENESVQELFNKISECNNSEMISSKKIKCIKKFETFQLDKVGCKYTHINIYKNFIELFDLEYYDESYIVHLKKALDQIKYSNKQKCKYYRQYNRSFIDSNTIYDNILTNYETVDVKIYSNYILPDYLNDHCVVNAKILLDKESPENININIDSTPIDRALNSQQYPTNESQKKSNIFVPLALRNMKKNPRKDGGDVNLLNVILYVIIIIIVYIIVLLNSVRKEKKYNIRYI
jgi:hypothetical protein